MRTVVAVIAGALIALTALPASAATSISQFVVPASVSLSSVQTLDVSGVASFDPPSRAQLFTDPTLDDELLLELTPPAQDLVAGFFAVDRDGRTLDFTWQVADLPDVPGGVPEVVRYLWDFSLQAPGSDEETLFELQAKFTNVGDRTGPQIAVPAGKLSGNCTVNKANVITCMKIGEPSVTIDGVANEITAHVPFDLLKNTDGNSLAVDGARMRQVTIFRGITAILQAVVSSGAMGDVAAAPDVTLGNHIELGLNLADTPDDLLDLSTHVLAAPDGSFAASLPLDGVLPGDYKVAARACVDAACAAAQAASVAIVP